MNPNQYHRVLLALDQALLVFKQTEELTPEDHQVEQQLELIRSYILKAESGHPFLVPPSLVGDRPQRPLFQRLKSQAAAFNEGAEAAARRLRVVIADDQEIVRNVLRAMLAIETDIEVIAEAANGAEAIEIVSASHPHVVIMDLNMPVLDGLSATSEVLRISPETRVLVYSANRDWETVRKAAEAGAIGYLFKPAGRLAVLSAVRSVHEGIMVFPDAEPLLASPTR